MSEQKKQYLKESFDDIKKLPIKENFFYIYHMIRLKYFFWHDFKLPRTKLFKLWKSLKTKNKTK